MYIVYLYIHSFVFPTLQKKGWLCAENIDLCANMLDRFTQLVVHRAHGPRLALCDGRGLVYEYGRGPVDIVVFSCICFIGGPFV